MRSSAAGWSRSHLSIGFGLAIAALGGCAETNTDPLDQKHVAQSYAEAMCEWQVECDCTAPPFDGSPQCQAASRSRFEALFEPAVHVGLRYDKACAERTLGQWDSYGCRTPNELSIAGELHDTRPSCGIYHGDGKLGEACSLAGGFSNCAQSLECVAGRCTSANLRCLSPLGKPDPNAPMMCALVRSLHAIVPDAGDGVGCDGSPVSGAAEPGEALADWELIDSDGKPRRLHEFCDRAVLMVAAATWCVECIQEAAALRQLHDQYAARGLAIITLLGQAVDGTAATPRDAADWKTTLELEHLVVADPEFAVAARYFFAGSGVVLPAAILLRPGGVVVSNNQGDEFARVEEALP